MTVHRNRFLVNKTSRCTEFQFYGYYYSTCFGQSFCPSSGVLSRTSALAQFMQLWPFVTKSSPILILVANGHNCIKFNKADVGLRNPDDGQKGCPKHVEYSNTNKMDLSASVGFIHKELHKVFSFLARFYILISKFLKMIAFLPICNSNLNLEGISYPRLQSHCSSEGTSKPFTVRYDLTCHKSYTLTCFNLWLPDRIYSIGKKLILLYRNLT